MSQYLTFLGKHKDSGVSVTIAELSRASHPLIDEVLEMLPNIPYGENLKLDENLIDNVILKLEKNADVLLRNYNNTAKYELKTEIKDGKNLTLLYPYSDDYNSNTDSIDFDSETINGSYDLYLWYRYQILIQEIVVLKRLNRYEEEWDLFATFG